MKNLLMFITAPIWMAVTYFCLCYIFIAQFYIIGISWFWIILLYSFIIGSVGLLYTLSSAVAIGIAYLYESSIIAMIIHCISGLIGFAFSIVYWFEDDKLSLIFGRMWEHYYIKTILLTPIFISIYLGIVSMMVISPIILMIKQISENRAWE